MAQPAEAFSLNDEPLAVDADLPVLALSVHLPNLLEDRQGIRLAPRKLGARFAALAANALQTNAP